MPDLSLLERGAAETERSAWMTVRWWFGTVEAGSPIVDETGQSMQFHLRNGGHQPFVDAMRKYDIERETRLLLQRAKGGAEAGETDEERADRVVRDRGVYEKEQIALLLFRDWNLTSKGDPVSCNKENITRIFERFPAVYEQTRDYIYAGKNFNLPALKAPEHPIAEIEKKQSPGLNGDCGSDSEAKTETISTVLPCENSETASAGLSG